VRQSGSASAALILDLKQRGLLESTIVIWAGEFGRLPINQGGSGRDHNRHAFTVLLAAAVFAAGHIHGATDEFGYKAVEKPVSCPQPAGHAARPARPRSHAPHLPPQRPRRNAHRPAVSGARVVEELLQTRRS